MTLFILFLALSSVFHGSFASKSTASPSSSTSSASSAFDTPPVVDKRSKLIFPDDVKWHCFYRTTTAVNGLNPMIWREDQYGNLLMAGLTNCKGALCYNFDHRYPVSEIHEAKADDETVANMMKSYKNCQALSTRVNSLKGSSSEASIQNVVHKFGCDEATKRIFTSNNFYYANAVQAKLIDQYRYDQIKAFYDAFKDTHFFKSFNNVSKTTRFAELQRQATQVAIEIMTAHDAAAIQPAHSDIDA